LPLCTTSQVATIGRHFVCGYLVLFLSLFLAFFDDYSRENGLETAWR